MYVRNNKMIAVEYRCGCGRTGQMITYAVERPAEDYPQEQFYIKCGRCGTQTFRFDSPQASEMSWAAMDGHAIEYSRPQSKVA